MQVRRWNLLLSLLLKRPHSQRWLRADCCDHITVSPLLLSVSFQNLRGRVTATWAKVQTQTLCHFQPRSQSFAAFYFLSDWLFRPSALLSSVSVSDCRLLLSFCWLDDWSPFFLHSLPFARPPPLSTLCPNPFHNFPPTVKSMEQSSHKNCIATRKKYGTFTLHTKWSES